MSGFKPVSAKWVRENPEKAKDLLNHRAELLNKQTKMIDRIRKRWSEVVILMTNDSPL